jgi:hypothetical protein
MQSAQDGPSSRDVRDLSWEEGERLSAEQQALHPSIERINAWAVEHPESFAGVWLDNSGFLDGTGPVRIGVGLAAREQYDPTSELAALVDDPTRLVVVDKAFPQAVLRAAQERVVARWMSSDPSGDHRVTGCGVDTQANALEVMLRRPDEDLEAQIRAEFPDVPVTIAYGYMSWG